MLTFGALTWAFYTLGSETFGQKLLDVLPEELPALFIISPAAYVWAKIMQDTGQIGGD